MNAPSLLRLIYLLTLAILCTSAPSNDVKNSSHVHKIELYDGVYVKIPEHNNDRKELLSFEIDTKNNDVVEGKLSDYYYYYLRIFLTRIK